MMLDTAQDTGRHKNLLRSGQREILVVREVHKGAKAQWSGSGGREGLQDRPLDFGAALSNEGRMRGDQGYTGKKNNMTEDQKRLNNLVFREIMQLTEN